MNTQTPLAGYIVEAPSSTKTFIDANLLTARQAAHQYSQKLAAQVASTDALDIEIHLAEFDAQHNVLAYITRVFTYHLHQSQIADENDTQTIDMAISSGWLADELPASINLTVGLNRDDSAFNSTQAVWNSLEEIACELDYYHLHRHDAGFGYVLIDEIGPYPPLPEADKLMAMSDQQLRQHLLRLQEAQALHCRSYTVLYDGFTYASSLIHNYNQHYAAEEERLSFRTEFLGNLPTRASSSNHL